MALMGGARGCVGQLPGLARTFLRRGDAPRQVQHLRLCFLMAASPTDGFYGQIAMFRRSLDALGGPYRRARMVVVFGSESISGTPLRWRPHFSRVRTYHVTPEAFQAKGYRAQTDARWTRIPDDCDFAIFVDADVMLLRPIDDLLAALVAEPAVAGVIAHYPFPQHPGDDPARKWAELADEVLGRDIPMEHVHTLLSDGLPASHRQCPFYVNFGFVVLPKKLARRIGPMFLKLTPRLMGRLANPYFAGQVALTLAVYGQGTPGRTIDIKYNFPNDALAESLHPESLADMRVIHYLRTQRFDRQRIFANEQMFQDFLELDLQGAEQILQEHVRSLTGGQYPFAHDTTHHHAMSP